jgi:hypothetical protein
LAALQDEKKAMKKRRNQNKWIFVTTADMKQFYIAAKASASCRSVHLC